MVIFLLEQAMRRLQLLANDSNEKPTLELYEVLLGCVDLDKENFGHTRPKFPLQGSNVDHKNLLYRRYVQNLNNL